MTPTKIPINQHIPLHDIYGGNDCCLCRAEEKIKELEKKIEALKSMCVMEEEPCKCNPIGSGEEFCNDGCYVRDILNKVYDLGADCPTDIKTIDEALKKIMKVASPLRYQRGMIPKDDDTINFILPLLKTALKYPIDQRLLSIIGGWRDTMDDKETLQELSEYVGMLWKKGQIPKEGECSECKGLGKIYVVSMVGNDFPLCPKCNGSGKAGKEEKDQVGNWGS